MAARFVADPLSDRPQIEIDGFAILYHRPSGMTHVVASPVPEMLAALAGDPADVGQIVTRLAAEHDLAGEGALEAIVAARLEELEAAGLVRRA
ncbi:MAG: HPr-rel-A system PqqD family peptide chaperone [Sphingomonas bacterium]|nr:HPr-rel-A system PqqD family peptide chaperone [Sphingomonas bacterium]MDB5688410.1 HPr-rel-A system PqqD family peptide chaperone [Sphingomonas bacterium]